MKRLLVILLIAGSVAALQAQSGGTPQPSPAPVRFGREKQMPDLSPHRAIQHGGTGHRTIGQQTTYPHLAGSPEITSGLS
ncbi:MAG: hypothetical protein BGO12_03860 [Verrucomicrobia bacterium 61-8]|nr:MAG: hypothetical protein BGO12_03860 [Verrucomicrobia bacterium 61-8]